MSEIRQMICKTANKKLSISSNVNCWIYTDQVCVIMPRGENELNLELMHLIDEHYLLAPKDGLELCDQLDDSFERCHSSIRDDRPADWHKNLKRKAA